MMSDNDTIRPTETTGMPTPPTNDPESPAVAYDRTGETQDETYGNEQAQRHRDAEEGRHAIWTGTDPVD